MSANKKQENFDWAVPVITGTAAVIIAYLMKDNQTGASPDQVAQDPDQTILYAFVRNPNGARIYKGHSQVPSTGYGYGREPISTLKVGTYVGKMTGITYQDLAQVTTVIDGKEYTYWVSKSDISTLDKVSGSMDQLKEKLQGDLKAIAHTFSQNFVSKIFG